eukprot:6211866-Pleurochrysis_carterae.AAC.2
MLLSRHSNLTASAKYKGNSSSPKISRIAKTPYGPSPSREAKRTPYCCAMRGQTPCAMGRLGQVR